MAAAVTASPNTSAQRLSLIHILTIVPLAFLVVSGGEVKLLQLSPNNSTADKVVDAVPGLIDKVSGIFGKEKTKKSPSPKEAAE